MPYKLSREAPVVVIKYERSPSCRASAGNTILIFWPSAPTCSLSPSSGTMRAGDRLLECFSGFGHYRRGLPYPSRRENGDQNPDTCRDRHTSKHQVIRIDRGNERPVPEEARRALKRKLRRYVRPSMASFSAIRVRHRRRRYHFLCKGPRTREGGCRGLLAQPQAFKDFTLVTPMNRRPTPLQGLRARGILRPRKRNHRIPRVKGVLVTRGNAGMTFSLNDGAIHHIPISGRRRSDGRHRRRRTWLLPSPSPSHRVSTSTRPP